MYKHSYPKLRRDEDIKDDYFGVEVPDPYRWLENINSPETKDFIEDQNELTSNFLKDVPYRHSLNEELTEIFEKPIRNIGCPKKVQNFLYQLSTSEGKIQNTLYKLDWTIREPQVFLDISKSHGPLSYISDMEFSDNGKTLMYAISSEDDDFQTIKFINVQEGEEYEEILFDVRCSIFSWMKNTNGLFYSSYHDVKRNMSVRHSELKQKLFYHTVGQKQKDDVIVVDFDDSNIIVHGQVGYFGKFLLVSVYKKEGYKYGFNKLYFSELWKQPLDRILELKPVIEKFEARYDYITNIGSQFFFRTNRKAPNFKVISIDLKKPEESNWEVLIPENPNKVLLACRPTYYNMLVVLYLKNAAHRLELHYLFSGLMIKKLPLKLGIVSAFSGKRDDSELFFKFTSLDTPSIIYMIDFTKEFVPVIFHELEIRSFNPDKYELNQVYFKSKDGTTISMFLLHYKSLQKNSSNPCFLFGYGAFGLNLPLSFSEIVLCFVHKFFGIFAIANIRGGGEHGERSHKAGKYKNKQNSFDDFQCAAKYLIKENYTNPSLLSIWGTTNGGLLIGACINQAPELFGAAIASGGLLDMLRFHKMLGGNIWRTEYGCADNRNHFETLYKYSPLHNVKVPKRNVQYPATLLLTASHNSNVQPSHSYKFISELQYKMGGESCQLSPLFIRIERTPEIGAPIERSKMVDLIVDMFCFVGRCLWLQCACTCRPPTEHDKPKKIKCFQNCF